MRFASLGTTRNILSSELLETTRIDVDYQVRITDARILTNIQVIELQVSLTARFEYLLNLTQQNFELLQQRESLLHAALASELSI